MFGYFCVSNDSEQFGIGYKVGQKNYFPPKSLKYFFEKRLKNLSIKVKNFGNPKFCN